MTTMLEPFRFGYDGCFGGTTLMVHADCLRWLTHVPENCLHAIVTDLPYGVKEYDLDQLTKRGNGNGGIWRIPPSFDGHTRSPFLASRPWMPMSDIACAAFSQNGQSLLIAPCFQGGTFLLPRTLLLPSCFMTHW